MAALAGLRVKAISVLGSTGSIGTQTLEIVQGFPDQFKVVASRQAETWRCWWSRSSSTVPRWWPWPMKRCSLS